MSFLHKIFIFDYFFQAEMLKKIEFGHQILAPKNGHHYHFWPVFAMIVISPIYLLYLLIQKVNSQSFWISVRLGRTNFYYLNIVFEYYFVPFFTKWKASTTTGKNLSLRYHIYSISVTSLYSTDLPNYPADKFLSIGNISSINKHELLRWSLIVISYHCCCCCCYYYLLLLLLLLLSLLN